MDVIRLLGHVDKNDEGKSLHLVSSLYHIGLGFLLTLLCSIWHETRLLSPFQCLL